MSESDNFVTHFLDLKVLPIAIELQLRTKILFQLFFRINGSGAEKHFPTELSLEIKGMPEGCGAADSCDSLSINCR